MCALVAPPHDTLKNEFFDGKLGEWPFVYHKRAKCTNKIVNVVQWRQNVLSLLKEETCKILINNVLPAVRERFLQGWHGKRTSTIKIHLDNAHPHVSSNGTTIKAKHSKVDHLLNRCRNLLRT